MVQYEEELRNVKQNLYDILGKGELGIKQYWRTVYQLLSKEGIAEGRYEEDDTREVTIRVSTSLIDKIPAKEYRGLEKTYISREDVELSPQAQEDIRKLSELEESTRNYLREQIGGKDEAIFVSKYDRLVRAYLINQIELPKCLSLDKLADIIGWMKRRLARDFIIQKDPKTIGRYDYDSLDEAINNL